MFVYLTFDGDVIGLFYLLFCFFRNRKFQNPIFVLRVDVVLVNGITYIETPAHCTIVAFAADVVTFLILLLILCVFRCGDRQISVF